MNNNNNNNANANFNTSKVKRMMKSKSFVVAFCAVAAVAVLLVGYNFRINAATKPVSVPVANKRLPQKHLITEDDINYVEIPSGALSGDYIQNSANVIGRYVNYDTTIPEGSLFYNDSIVLESDLPDAALGNVPDGETLYYLSVNMLTSYTNEILPNRYIDIYITTKENGKALVGKLLKNVKVLQVKTSDGLNVFENSEEQRVPYVILFSLKEEDHLLLRKIDAINNYSIGTNDSGFSKIQIIPVPTTAYFNDGDAEVKAEVSSQYLKDYILNLSAPLADDYDVPTSSTTTPNTTE